MPPQQPSRADSFSFILGCTSTNSFLLVCDAAVLEPLLFLHGFSCMGSTPSTLRMSNVGLSLFLRSSAHLGFALSAFSRVNLELPSSVMEVSYPNFLVLLQGLAHLDSPLLAVAFESLESAPLLRSTAQLGLFLFLFSSARMDPAPPAAGFTALGFLPLLRGVCRLDFSLLVAGAALSGSPPSLQSFAYLGVRTPVKGKSGARMAHRLLISENLWGSAMPRLVLIHIHMLHGQTNSFGTYVTPNSNN